MMEHVNVMGVIGLVCAVLGLGTQGVPLKLTQQTSPFVMIAYFSMGACFGGMCLFASLLHVEISSDRQIFPLIHVVADVVTEGGWGVVAALVYTPGKVLQLWSVRQLGVGTSTGLIASVNSMVAFFVGMLFLGDMPHNLPVASLGIGALLFGAIGMTQCKPSSTEKTMLPLAATNSRTSNFLDYRALMAAVVSGICLGMQGVPFRLGSRNPYATAAIFLLVQAPVTCFLLLACGVPLPQKQEEVGAYAKIATQHDGAEEKNNKNSSMTLGLAGGIIFSFAAIGQVVTVSSFGATVGMPLTQLNLVVAGVWGIAYFREIKQLTSVLLFVCSAALAMLGGFLLSL